jgi:molybdenum cofactor synthesis domain-containing protein
MHVLVELISIGRELLIGRTVNTNASWLADRVTRMGGVVRRIVAVDDDLDEIASSIKEAASRGAELVVTTGGLGTTPDDKTMEGVAKALGVELELNVDALGMLEERVGRRVEEPHVRKMAYLPRGAKPLYNPVGAAPGALVGLGSTLIAVLPGVPAEMKGMFELHVEPLLRGVVKEAFYDVEATVRGVYEAALAPILEEAARRHPKAYVKSHPRLEGGESVIKLHVACRAARVEEARAEAEEVLRWLLQQAERCGGRVEQAPRGLT